MIASVLLAKNNKETIHVLDFGGACGAHYFETRKGLPDDINLKWIVVETPTMVKYASNISSNELSFSVNLEDATSKLGKIDLIYTSGTIQCVDKPYDYLNKLISINTDYILFNRLGLNTGNYDVIVTHESLLSWNGVGPLPVQFKDRWIKYPFQFIQRQKFEDIMNSNYFVLFEFEERSGVFPVNKEKLEGKGVLYKRRVT